MDRLERHHAHHLLHVRLGDLAVEPLRLLALARRYTRHGVAAVVEQVREVVIGPNRDNVRWEDLQDAAARYGERQ